MADLAIRRVIPVLVCVVSIYNDSCDGVLAVRREDAAGDDERVARLAGRDDGRRPYRV
jgi:hypothetical protein